MKQTAIVNTTIYACCIDSDYCPVIFNIDRTTNRPSTSKAALSIRISCVFGSINFQTKAHKVTINDMRKTKNTMSLNIYV